MRDQSTTAGPVVIVGASLAGATVAAALREADFVGDIILLGAEEQLPYERPPLSKGYLTGATSAEKLVVQHPAFYAENHIVLRLGQTAMSLDPGRRQVRLATGETVSYATLVIATGAQNIQPRLPGLSLPGVFQLRTLAEADALRSALIGARTAVTVGMGFIGCEIAATLTGHGLQVTAVDAGPGPLWGPLGAQVSGVARRWHEQHGVRVLADRGVAEIVPRKGGAAGAVVRLTGGEQLAADVVVVGVGVRAATGWLIDAPLHLDGGGVGVDSDGRSNLPHVWAVGDVAAVWDPMTATHRRHEHWASTIAAARRAAFLIAGMPPEPAQPPYFWSDQYDKTLQYAGRHDRDDLLVVRGELPEVDQPFTGFYLRDGVVTAVLAVNDGRQFRRGQRLIGRTARPAELADPTIDLRQLALPVPAPVS